MDDRGIELEDFLNFLSLACKVNLQENGDENKNLELDLNELASNRLITRLFEHLQQTKMTGDRRLEMQQSLITVEEQELKNDSMRYAKADLEVNNVTADLADIQHLNKVVELLKGKLFELLNEGIFDSILTYLTPSKFVPANANVSSVQSESKPTTGLKKKREKKKRNAVEVKPTTKNETEIEIHVYDEVKGFKRDFKCLQSLLTTNMGYFSEITKGQKLEEMDISVHCDISIFEWLMKWIKRDSHANASESSPKLDYKNVVPIMVSANFLQMKPLFQDCLYFCKANLNDVVKYSSNLTCLSDHILKKLCDKLSNTEVQQLKDKKDKIKSRLFCKLIMSLNEEEPEKHQGHYASLAYLYFCLNCGKLVTRVSAPYVPCRIQCITIKYNGDVIFNHFRDPKWNINEHIKSIWTEYKSWSCTYWRLWSQCHYLYCYMCHTMYAVAFADCCPYHPQQPHFYPMEQFQTTNSPIGRYPCCGSKAIRYETITMRSGCKLRSHIPKLLTNDDSFIQTTIDLFPDLIKMKYADDNVAPFVEDYDLANFDGLYKNTFLDKDKQGYNLGLLKGPLYEAYMKSIKKYKSVGTWEPKHEASPMKTGEYFENTDYCSIGESENSDVSYIHDISIVNRPNAAESYEETLQPKNLESEMKPVWSSRYSIRHNQDNQRDYEEIAFQSMSEILLQQSNHEKMSKRPLTDVANHNLGGTYAQIEAEWKEMGSRSCGNKITNK